jgi:CTP:molybdopterin cytidylyltransferase MocA
LIGGLVLAAGAGRRFGGVKQVAEFRGLPLLEHALIAMGVVERKVVVLGANADVVRARVPLHGADPVVADDWHDGLSASLSVGVTALEDCEAVVVTLGDQPLIAAGAIRRVIAARGPTPGVRATYGGVPGHPVLLERSLFGAVMELRGDRGAGELLHGAREVSCDGLGSPVDVDTPEALRLLGSPNT